MPLEILLMLVVGGITGIALLTHGLGLSKRRAFHDEAEARAAWLR
jgi:nitrate reductase gamma subunit